VTTAGTVVGTDASVGSAFVCVTDISLDSGMAVDASLTGIMAAFAAGTGVTATRTAATGTTAAVVLVAALAAVVLLGVSAAVVLLEASAPAARVWVTAAAVVRFGSDGGVLLGRAAAVFGGAILPDTVGGCACLGSATCGRTGSSGARSGFASGSDF
jgi:hypothetical protein